MKPIALSGHGRPLTRVRYNTHGDLLFSSSKDNNIIAWRAQSGERLGTYAPSKASNLDIDPSYDTVDLLAASADSTLKIYDVRTGTKLKELALDSAPIRFTKYAQGGKEAFYVVDALAGVAHSIINVFNVDQFKNNPNDCEVIKFSVDGKSKVSSIVWGDLNRTIITGHEKGGICMWDVKTGTLIAEEQIFESRVTDIQMDVTCSFLICSSKDHTAKIVDAKTLEVKRIFKTDRPINSASISPIRPHVIVGGGQEAADVTTTHHEGRFKVRFFHLAYSEELGSLEGHFGPVNTLEFSPDGRSFSSGGEDGYIRINHLDEDYFEFKLGGEY